MLAVAAPRSLAAVAAIAVALSGLLPAPHLHADHAGAIVHVHAVAGPLASPDHDADDHGHAVLRHGDHADARPIALSYSAAARFDLPVATEAARVSIDAPDGRGIHRLSRGKTRPTHDPPLRFTSSPAPPAVV